MPLPLVPVRQHRFPDGATLARQLAADVAVSLERRLASDGAAGLVVSGGRTPLPFLRGLALHSLDWAQVHVTLADERCVPSDHPASNRRLVSDAFAGTPAGAAQLLSLDATTRDAAQRWSGGLSRLPRPFAAVVLGMGDDGHFASLFPHMPGLAAALDAATTPAFVPGVAPVEPKARLSLTLSALLDTDLLALHITGPTKLATLEQAGSPGTAADMPVRALLGQCRVKLDVYYSV